MANSTFIKVPYNVDEPATLRRFLELLIEKLDEAFGNRGGEGFTTDEEFKVTARNLFDIVEELSKESSTYVKLDGSRLIEAPLQYAKNYDLQHDKALVYKKFIEDQAYTSNPKQDGIADISLPVVVASDDYTKEELQELANQIQDLQATLNNMLEALRLSNILRKV